MNKKEYLIYCAMEECNELAKELSKGVRFGMDKIEINKTYTNAERISREYYDLIAVMEMLVQEGIFSLHSGQTGKTFIQQKKVKLEGYIKLAKLRGIIEE